MKTLFSFSTHTHRNTPTYTHIEVSGTYMQLEDNGEMLSNFWEKNDFQLKSLDKP